MAAQQPADGAKSASSKSKRSLFDNYIISYDFFSGFKFGFVYSKMVLSLVVVIGVFLVCAVVVVEIITYVYTKWANSFFVCCSAPQANRSVCLCTSLSLSRALVRLCHLPFICSRFHLTTLNQCVLK